MFKFAVLCAIIASATAAPGALYSSPFTQYSSIWAPGTTTIAKQDNSVIYPSQLGYYAAAPLAYTHFIKKRSAPLAHGFIAPSTYIAGSPYLAPTSYVASASFINGHVVPAVAPIGPAVHLIKKRSAPLFHSTYITPSTYSAATAPFLTTYSSAPLISSTQLISQPLTYTHFIKK